MGDLKMRKLFKLWIGFIFLFFSLASASFVSQAAETQEGTQEGEAPSLKERMEDIFDYAKGIFMEAKSDSITEDGEWVNGDIVVVILCIAVVLIIVLYIIFDFIRSPFRKKIKILVELALAIGIVGGGLWFLWNQALNEQQKEVIESQIISETETESND